MHKENKNISILYLIKNLFFIKNYKYPLRYKINNKTFKTGLLFILELIDLNHIKSNQKQSHNTNKHIQTRKIQDTILQKNIKAKALSAKIELNHKEII